MSSKRKALEAELEEQKKRLKETSDTVASEFKCAISYELPVDPVTAEDGQVYERAAIEDWIAKAEANELPLRSPTHNTPMGPRLFPATQVRNTLEQMVRSGTISGPLADAWSKKLEEEKADAEYVASVRARAEGGDADAMFELGTMFSYGDKGMPEDPKQAAVWYRRGRDLDHATCTIHLGHCYVQGHGVGKSFSMAMYLYTVAAQNGSEHGCFLLGHSIACEYSGMKRDVQEAARWFSAMKEAPHRDDCDINRTYAAKWLRKHASK